MGTDAISRSALMDAVLERLTIGKRVDGVLVLREKITARELNTLLTDAPTLDVQPVVRCGGCKWYDSAFYVCSKCGVCVNRDFYCADGARMDVEESTC